MIVFGKNVAKEVISNNIKMCLYMRKINNLPTFYAIHIYIIRNHIFDRTQDAQSFIC